MDKEIVNFGLTMANRILFEEEIGEQNIICKVNGEESNANIPIQEDSFTNKEDCRVRNALGNIEQDSTMDTELNTQTSENQTPNKVLERDDNVNTNHESNMDQINNTGGKNKDEDTVKISSLIKGNNEQESDRTEINSNNIIEMGNTRQEIEKSNETPTINDTAEAKIGKTDIMVDISPSAIETNDETSSHLNDVKKNVKREGHLVGEGVNGDNVDGTYDVFGSDNQIYRKYRLRKSGQKSYKEPTIDWKPKRRESSDNEPTSIECPVCCMGFESKRALHVHQKHHESVVEYTCSLCSEKFKTNGDLIAHKSVHNSESFLCKKCKLAFSDHCDYLQHILTHPTTCSRFTCSECGLRYNRKNYKLHIWTHFAKKFKCNMCSYVGNKEINLKNHINQQHRDHVTCVECGMVFPNKYNLVSHMVSHTGVKKFQCLYCGKCFAHSCGRKIHTRQHTGEKPYSCDICGHKSAQKNDMQRHKITHETEKKFSCHLCPKKYFYKPYLVSHMRSHTRENLYECPECDGKFVNPSGLKTHYMFKHLSERPVECMFCNKRFINNNQYKKHTKSKYHKRNAYGHMKKSENGDM